MFCKNCSGDKYRVVSVDRNKRYIPEMEKWVYSDDYDTRLVLCRRCNTLYYVQSAIVCEVKRKPKRDSGMFD